MTIIPTTLNDRGSAKLNAFIEDNALNWSFNGCVDAITDTISFQNMEPTDRYFEWETGRKTPTGYVETITFDVEDIQFEELED